MSRFCPILNTRITYQACEDCDEKPCKKTDSHKITKEKSTEASTNKSALKTENLFS